MLLLCSEPPKASHLRVKAKVRTLIQKALLHLVPSLFSTYSYSLFFPLAYLIYPYGPSPHTRHSPVSGCACSLSTLPGMLFTDSNTACPSLPSRLFLEIFQNNNFKITTPSPHKISSFPAIYFCS